MKDVERTTVDMTRKYAANKSALLLVVLSATDDFQNSKALQIARELDASGERTVGVVTKIDMLQGAQHLQAVVNNMVGSSENAIPLAHGYFAVRN